MAGLKKRTLGRLIKEHPEVLAVLDRHGVSFCAGCFLTLFSSVERAAAYHAVSDRAAFLKDLEKALRHSS
ncbi:MAG: hypothetical protein HY921_12425 [Elusimicrobia bacterium]|nr:hypothetical protein [Elusimicrobiota bacterium]